jgi:hypothetical protein
MDNKFYEMTRTEYEDKDYSCLGNTPYFYENENELKKEFSDSAIKEIEIFLSKYKKNWSDFYEAIEYAISCSCTELDGSQNFSDQLSGSNYFASYKEAVNCLLKDLSIDDKLDDIDEISDALIEEINEACEYKYYIDIIEEEEEDIEDNI